MRLLNLNNSKHEEEIKALLDTPPYDHTYCNSLGYDIMKKFVEVKSFNGKYNLDEIYYTHHNTAIVNKCEKTIFEQLKLFPYEIHSLKIIETTDIKWENQEVVYERNVTKITL
jgi:hypothetical protein